MDFFFSFYDTVVRVSLNAFIWDLICCNWLSGFEDIRLSGFLGDTCRKNCFLAITEKIFGAHQKNFHILIPGIDIYHLSYYELGRQIVPGPGPPGPGPPGPPGPDWILRCTLWVAPKTLLKPTYIHIKHIHVVTYI